MSDHPTSPETPSPITLAEVISLFPPWVIAQSPSGALTATRRRGNQVRVVGADSPAEMAAALLRIERQETTE